MAHAWKACWGQPLASSNLASSATLTSQNARPTVTVGRASWFRPRSDGTGQPGGFGGSSAAAPPRTDAGRGRPHRDPDPGSQNTTRDISRRCHGGRSTHSRPRLTTSDIGQRGHGRTPRAALCAAPGTEQHRSCSRHGAGQRTSEVGLTAAPGGAAARVVLVSGCRRVPVMASEAVDRRCAARVVLVSVRRVRVTAAGSVSDGAPERPVTGSRPRCRRGSPGRPGGAGPRSRRARSRRTPRR